MVHPAYPSYDSPDLVFETETSNVIADILNISDLEDASSKRDFAEIIESSKLFWLAFCKAVSQIGGNEDDCFSVSLDARNVVILSRDDIRQDVQRFLEDIRKVFERAYKEKKPFLLLSVCYSRNYYIEEKKDTVDLTKYNWDRQTKLSEYLFATVVQPSMQGLCRSIGAVSSAIIVSQKYFFGEDLGTRTQKTHAFNIDWINGENVVYPIGAKTIPPRGAELQKNLRSMYESQTFCDLSLMAKDGAVKVHSVALFTYGGEVVQKMLTSKMKESLEKEVHFSEFSLSTVKAFVDFVYSGEKGLTPTSISKNGVNLCELFQMAHTYQVQELIDCCTNLFSLISSIKDKEVIRELAELYDNEHLKTLYRYLFFPRLL